MTDRVGQQLGNYQLIRLMGTGGFAEVYLGQHIYLNTQAAIKVMNAQIAKDDRGQFRTEASNLAQLIHPNIVRVLDFGIEGKTPFIVMDYAPNGTLRDRHPRMSYIPLSIVVPYVQQLAAALQYAHDAKLIHRDIKPENMLLGRNNEILLSDFGLAIIAQNSRSVNTGELAGTILYMAPEQIQGRPRLASDQYSLAAVVYEWLSGNRLFSGSTTEIVEQHLYNLPPPLRQKVPSIPPAVEQVIFRALEKDPQQRFPGIQAFAEAFVQASPPEVEQTVSTPTPIVTTPPSSSTPSTPQNSQQQLLLARGNDLFDKQQFTEALAAYEQAIQLDPNYAPGYIGKGLALRNLNRYAEALEAYEQAIRLDPNDATVHNNKGNALNDLLRYNEALLACERAIQLTPNYLAAYNNKGRALNGLKRHPEALLAYDYVLQLNPNFTVAHHNKGLALLALERYEEALQSFDRAIQLNPNYISAYQNKAITLEKLGRTSQAQEARQQARKLER